MSDNVENFVNGSENFNVWVEVNKYLTLLELDTLF